MSSSLNPKRVAIVGGGPAGLAAAVALVTSRDLRDANLHLELFEVGSRLGGRAASFVDRASGMTLDTCQHILMGCCTASLDFFRTVGLLDRFEVYDRYHFFDASGKCHDFAATRFLPAPLHLLPGFWRLKYLKQSDRLRIIRSLMRLRKLTLSDCKGRTIGDWLEKEGHSAEARRRFWAVVLTSALSESLDRASLRAARQVFVDGFLRSQDAYRLWVPREPLGVLFDEAVGTWLEERGVVLHRQTPVRRLVVETSSDQSPFVQAIQTCEGQTRKFDQFIVAIPSRRFQRLIEASCMISPIIVSPTIVSPVACDGATPFPVTGDQANNLEDAPITAVHLWFDRPISNLPHAVLADQHGNWMFRPPWTDPNYAQLVISASRSLLGLTREAREAIVQQLTTELVQTVSSSRKQAEREPPKLIRYHISMHPRAVFSITPESDRYRPEAQTSFKNLYLAGDWTATDWPSTIEGSLRSGTTAANLSLLNTEH